jgi:hypothetical protein
MISLILPYWDRQEAANKSFELLEKHYKGLELEVIVVDDGNVIPFKKPSVELDIKVIRLPTKTVPMCPATVWNAGVAAAEGDIVVLSCIEILHDTPILEQLAQVEGKEYALAAAWCPEEQKWHCHSSVTVPTCPDGSGIAFCAAIRKEFFQQVGGFDENYRKGAGYEDRDFIWKLHEAGAKFIHRDDLVVTHPKSGATIHWADGSFEINQSYYLKKWKKQIEGLDYVTFLCLKAGTLYGPEYVNNLRDMVSRNLPYGTRGRFVCLTDDPEGLDEGIDVIPLPSDLEGWWGKLYMFKRGLFSEGERVIFMDLDTLLVGRIADIAAYRGQFATLRDFYFPTQIGPAIIAWRVGEFAYSIWDEWVAQGKPRHRMGDLWWLNNLDQGRFPKRIDILQDLYPGKFVSYKAHCHPYPPKGASVVCFHGQPKPHMCDSKWVKDVWKVGGAGMADLEIVANTENDLVKRNVLSACKRNIPRLELSEPHDKHAVIVGGGPSINDTWAEIEWRKYNGQTIVAINGSAKWLNDRGIIPDFHVVIDARPENAEFIADSKEHYLASQCDPSVFDRANNITLFHLNTHGIQDYLPDSKAHLISSGSTVGLAAMAVMYCLGYRNLHLHGFDSSYEENHHAYEQKQNDSDDVVNVSVNGENFKAAPWMVAQAQQFQELAIQLAEAGTVITVAGKGLLPHVARCMSF